MVLLQYILTLIFDFIKSTNYIGADCAILLHAIYILAFMHVCIE